jgi:hypothetical protein
MFYPFQEHVVSKTRRAQFCFPALAVDREAGTLLQCLGLSQITARHLAHDNGAVITVA